MPHRDLDFPHRILVADGTATLRSAVGAIFDDEKYHIVVAINGKDALNKASAQHFDLVVTGIAMAELDGLELLGALRKVKPHQPVFVVAQGNGKIDATYLRYAVLLGATGTFHHPLDPQTFRSQAEAAIDQSNPSATRHKACKP